MQSLSVSLVLIAAMAVAAPLAARFVERAVKVPIVVFEIVLGMLLGPSLLGWVQSTQFTDTLADFGLAMLFFVAGNEIDFRAIRGRPLGRASMRLGHLPGGRCGCRLCSDVRSRAAW